MQLKPTFAPWRRGVVARPSVSPATIAPTLTGNPDQFTALNDRIKAPPLPLPPIISPQRVTIVRHGESTWNAERRVQGSSDLSVLTEKGVQQALATKDMLAPMQFSQMWYSPLARASKTAELVWNGRVAPQHCDPVLREIDLYCFQGLEKAEVKDRYPNEYSKWHGHPEEFELDGHYPVHETWFRASLAWQKVLTASEADPGHSLVVAHNNTNQALISVALELPVTFFRRLTQCNAAVSQIEFTPMGEGQPPEAVLLCLNQSKTGNPVKPKSKVLSKVILVVASPDQTAQEACAELISTTPVRHVLLLAPTSPEVTAAQQPLASLLITKCRTAKGEEPDLVTLLQEAGNEAWQSVIRAASDDGGCNVVVVLDSQSAAGLTCSAFGLGQMARHKFRFDLGGISVFDFHSPPGQRTGVARCLNSRSHLPGQIA